MKRLSTNDDTPFTPTEKTKHFIIEAERLKEEGEFKSYVNLGKEIGIGGPTLSNIRNGRADITPDAYRKFCDLYLNGNIKGASLEAINKTIEKEHAVIKNDDEYLRGIIQDLARGSASTLEMNKSISDANKSISEANRIMALSHDKLIDSNKDANANNKKLLAMVEYKYLPNLNSEDINYQAASDSAVRVIDAMAKTLVRNGQYSNVEEASDYLDTLLNGDSAAAALGHNQKKTDKTNKHKQT